MRRSRRLTRLVRWLFAAVLVLSAGLGVANLAGNFAIRAGILSVMVNDGTCRIGVLDGELFPYGWECEMVPRDTYITYYGHIFFITPLWLLWLVALLATIWMWRRDRARPPGHCVRCGYDLTGNVSGRCPECGTAFKREEKEA